MALPEFEHSPYGYWIDLERNVYPLSAPQTHAIHPAISHFPDNGHQKIDNALEAGYGAVSIYENSFSIRTRKGAIPSPVIGDLSRIIKLHNPETIITDHHGSGDPETILRNMRRTSTHTVSSSIGYPPTYASVWEEVAALRSQLNDARSTISLLIMDENQDQRVKDFIKAFDDIKNIYSTMKKNYDKSEQICGNRSLNDTQKMDQLGYWTFHELNRNIWYMGKLLNDLKTG